MIAIYDERMINKKKIKKVCTLFVAFMLFITLFTSYNVLVNATSGSTNVNEIQAQIDQLPDLKDYRSFQKEEVQPLLLEIRDNINKLTLEEEKMLDTTKLVNLEAAVQMVIKAYYYINEETGLEPPTSMNENPELKSADLGDKVLAIPVFDNDTHYLAAVEGASKRNDTYEEILNKGERNETEFGLSFMKNKKWHSNSNCSFRIGVKTNSMHPMTIKENIDGTWGTEKAENSLLLLMNKEMTIEPKQISGYKFHHLKTKDYHSVDGDMWAGTPGYKEWIDMDMEAVGLSQPDENGKMYWKSSITASDYTDLIYNYYSLIRNVK